MTLENIRNLGLKINILQYNCLNQGWEAAKRKFSKNCPQSLCVKQFLGSFKKGSRKFRDIMDAKGKKGNLKNMQQVKTYKKVTEIENIDTARLRKMHTMWSRHFLDSKTRDFIFKFYNNILGINQRVNKFNPTTCPSCTFCSISMTLPAPLETFRHIFYDCPSVEKILYSFFNKFMNIPLVECDVFFSGAVTNTESKNVVFQMCMDIYLDTTSGYLSWKKNCQYQI